MERKALRCGDCGCASLTAQAESDGDRHGFKAIWLKCTGCGSETRFAPPEPRIQVDNHAENPGDGTICVFD